MCAETRRAEMQRTEDVHVAMLARDMNYAEEVIHDVYAAMRNHISVSPSVYGCFICCDRFSSIEQLFRCPRKGFLCMCRFPYSAATEQRFSDSYYERPSRGNTDCSYV